MNRRWCALLALALVLALPGGLSRAATPAAADKGAERRERSTVMDERVYRRLAAAQELMGDGRLDEALQRLDDLSRGRLNDYEQALVYQTYGFVYSQRGDYQQAVDYFERCIALDALPDEAQQGMLYSLASLYTTRGQHQQAVDTLTRWFGLVEKPGADAYAMMASNYAAMERYAQAQSWIHQANQLAQQPTESWYQLELAVDFEVEDYTAAVRLLHRAIPLWPKEFQYWDSLASAYMQMDDDKRALAVMMLAYRQGLVEDEDKLLNVVRMNLYLQLPYTAAKILQAEMDGGRISPSRDHLQLLFTAWQSARELDRAVTVLDRLAPMADNGGFYLQKAQLLARTGDWEEVLSAAQKALDKGGLERPASAYILLGMAAVELDRLDEATQAFQQATRFDDASRRTARAWLDFVRDRRQAAAAG